jgi:predicted ATP-grasp superfamily ATP-dependent carboligase
MQDPRIKTDYNFVIAPEHDNSLNKLIEAYSEGLSDSAICKALQITKEEYEAILASALQKLRSFLK